MVQREKWGKAGGGNERELIALGQAKRGYSQKNRENGSSKHALPILEIVSN